MATDACGEHSARKSPRANQLEESCEEKSRDEEKEKLGIEIQKVKMPGEGKNVVGRKWENGEQGEK